MKRMAIVMCGLLGAAMAHANPVGFNQDQPARSSDLLTAAKTLAVQASRPAPGPVLGSNPASAADKESREYLNNADGSVTIVHPIFRMAGRPLYISLDSDKDGVCRLFGYGQYIDKSLLFSPVDDIYGHLAALIDNRGEVADLVQINLSPYAITRIGCAKP